MRNTIILFFSGTTCIKSPEADAYNMFLLSVAIDPDQIILVRGLLA